MRRPGTALVLLMVGAAGVLSAADRFDDYYDPLSDRWRDKVDSPTIRLKLGTAPSIDRVHSRASFNGSPSPAVSGGAQTWFEPDAGLNPAVAVELLGSAYGSTELSADRLGIAFEYSRRTATYTLNGIETPELSVNTYGVAFLATRSWHLDKTWSIEAMGKLGGGVLQASQYAVSPRAARWEVIGAGSARGLYAEGGVRLSLLAEAGNWRWGALVEYTAGFGSAHWGEAGPVGEASVKSDYTWYGLSAGVLVGHTF